MYSEKELTNLNHVGLPEINVPYSFFKYLSQKNSASFAAKD